jgi:hypothetical protein
VTPQTGPGLAVQNPDPRDQQLQQMVATIQNQARYIHQASSLIEQERETRETEAFERTIADLSDEEQRAARAERKVELLQKQQEAIAAQQRQQQAQNNMRTQQQAKTMIAAMTAADYGLPPTAQQYLMGAASPEQMKQMAEGLASGGYGKAPAAAQPVAEPVAQQAAVNPAHLGGDMSPSSDVAPKIERGSGDLMGLIQQTSYQVSGLTE